LIKKAVSLILLFTQPLFAVTSVSDTFTGTDGTAITAHTPDVGGAWSACQGASPTLQSNRVQMEQTAGDSRALVGTTMPDADYEVSMDLIWVGATCDAKLGVMGRNNNDVQCRGLEYEAWYDCANNRYELIVVSGFNPTSLGTFAATYTQGQTHSLKLDMNGTTISLYVDGTSQISVTNSAASSAAQAGLRMNLVVTKTSLVGDNFLAQDPVAAGAAAPLRNGMLFFMRR
jgi:hypothetical protein